MVSVCESSSAVWTMVATEVPHAPSRSGRDDDIVVMAGTTTTLDGVTDAAALTSVEGMEGTEPLASFHQPPPPPQQQRQHQENTPQANAAAASAAATALALGECKAVLQNLLEWQEAGKKVTTWGTNAVLQQHQQHTPALHVAPSGAGAGCKRSRPAAGGEGVASPAVAAATADDLSPQEFLWRILAERGYETAAMPANKQAFFGPPTNKQVQDYDLAIVNAVKTGDLEGLQAMAAQGRQMDACNRHGESIVHISCRRGQADTLRFLLANGGRVHMCDDLGRTPLHDACWAKVPVFDCISTILDADPRLIRVVDCRGASPLAYIRREHWAEWKAFFDSKKEIYWSPLAGSPMGDRKPSTHPQEQEFFAAAPVTAAAAATGMDCDEQQPESTEEAREVETLVVSPSKRTSARQMQRKRSRDGLMMLDAALPTL